MSKEGKPLDLEELADVIIRKVYPTYDSQNTPLRIRNGMLFLKERIKFELEQQIRSTVQELEEGIKRCIEWAECQTDMSKEDMLEQLREDIETEIKKYFPEEVIENGNI